MSSDRPPPGSRRPIAEYLPITIDRKVWRKKLSESKRKKKKPFERRAADAKHKSTADSIKKKEREQVFLFYAVMHKRDFSFFFFFV